MLKRGPNCPRGTGHRQGLPKALYSTRAPTGTQRRGEGQGTRWCIFKLNEDLPQRSEYCSPPFIRGATRAVANPAWALLFINSVHTMLRGDMSTSHFQGKWETETVWRLSPKTRMDGDDDSDTCFRNKTRTVPYDKHIN